ncbi:MAG: 3,5-nucleoside bisphosphate phosphatase [Thermoleophilaceae bacterium]|nr:3,5-nucleoside bisphosphate phosphatase [Thermoleophilaceae bacterium]
MPPQTFDLQSHSVHSDGNHSAAEVVAFAARAGVELLALSDHDTVDGVQEALDASERHGVRIVRATEISAVEGPHEDLHVLGYGIDHTDATLAERLLDAREDRVHRADRMGDRLQELGYAIDDAPLEARRAAGKPIGRPHLSAAVLQHPGNAERLRSEGYTDVSSFLPDFLIQGKPAYVARTHPTVGEAIAWIHEAGGVAIWAHPFWDIDDPAEVLDAVDRFTEQGLDGVEVFYPTHDADQTRLLLESCTERELLATGSSDFHGVEHRLFSEFLAYDLHGLEPRLGPIAAA